MKWDLKGGLPEGFVYAASTVVSYRREFKLDENGVVNGRIDLKDPKAAYRDYEYISAVYRERMKLPVRIETECSFDAFGAPLIVFSETMTQKENGWREYGEHFEAVLYEGGINMWHITPKQEGGQQVEAVCKAKNAYPAGKLTRLTVTLRQDGIEAEADGFTAKGECSLPEEMYVGFTACEGINRFSSFSAEEI